MVRWIRSWQKPMSTLEIHIQSTEWIEVDGKRMHAAQALAKIEDLNIDSETKVIIISSDQIGMGLVHDFRDAVQSRGVRRITFKSQSSTKNSGNLRRYHPS